MTSLIVPGVLIKIIICILLATAALLVLFWTVPVHWQIRLDASDEQSEASLIFSWMGPLVRIVFSPAEGDSGFGTVRVLGIPVKRIRMEEL